MATTKTQRLGILLILAVTVIGTIGSFAAMILSTRNQSDQQVKYQQAVSKYQADQKVYQEKADTQAKELSAKYYESFKQHAARVGAFDINSVKSVETEDVVVGDGEEVTGKTKLATYYIGWDANGHVFDQSIDTTNSKLKSPLPISEGLDNASLIDGWKEGMKGMRINGVRVIKIPSDKAYGEQGSKDSEGKETIAPNMPLTFVVMAIPMPAEIPQPDTAELMKLYSEMNG